MYGLFLVLVTGYRNWPNPDVVFLELDRIRTEIGDPVTGSTNLLIVHGDCKSGWPSQGFTSDDAESVDQLAKKWANHYEIPQLIVPARWNFGGYGKDEGPRRNRHMVNLVCDTLVNKYTERAIKNMHQCLAFLHPQSKGTRDCIRKIEEANLNLRVIDPNGSVIRERFRE